MIKTIKKYTIEDRTSNPNKVHLSNAHQMGFIFKLLSFGHRRDARSSGTSAACPSFLLTAPSGKGL